MKNPHLYRGGHGPLLRIIGGLIGMAHTVVRIVAHIRMAHTPKAQHSRKALAIYPIKNQDHGVEQVATRMEARHQEVMEDMVRHQVDIVTDIVEDRVAADTANQCGG
jgi:hypothetical protein